MKHDVKTSDRSERAKSYTKPTLDRRAKLSNVTEGTAQIIPVSGVIVG